MGTRSEVLSPTAMPTSRALLRACLVRAYLTNSASVTFCAISGSKSDRVDLLLNGTERRPVRSSLGGDQKRSKCQQPCLPTRRSRGYLERTKPARTSSGFLVFDSRRLDSSKIGDSLTPISTHSCSTDGSSHLQTEKELRMESARYNLLGVISPVLTI